MGTWILAAGLPGDIGHFLVGRGRELAEGEGTIGLLAKEETVGDQAEEQAW